MRKKCQFCARTAWARQHWRYFFFVCFSAKTGTFPSRYNFVVITSCSSGNESLTKSNDKNSHTRYYFLMAGKKNKQIINRSYKQTPKKKRREIPIISEKIASSFSAWKDRTPTLGSFKKKKSQKEKVALKLFDEASPRKLLLFLEKEKKSYTKSKAICKRKCKISKCDEFH